MNTNRSSVGRPTLLAALVSAALAACGGGGASNEAPITPSPANGVTPSPAPADNGNYNGTVESTAHIFQWRVSTNLSLSLKDASGAVLSSPKCEAVDSNAVSVSEDCSKITALRLGDQGVRVSAGSTTGKFSLKVQPQRTALSTAGDGMGVMLVLPEGNVLAWGANFSGALGQGTGVSTGATPILPTLVKDQAGLNALQGVVQSSRGDEHALALASDGHVWAWGRNTGRQLGADVLNQAMLPVPMRNMAGTGDLGHVVQVEAAKGNSLMLLDDGRVLAVGSSTEGGTTLKSGARTYPDLVKGLDGQALQGIVQIAGIDSNGAALTAEGKVLQWDFRALRPVLRVGGAELSDAISLIGGYYSAYALLKDGTVAAWGENNRGQLGQGTTTTGKSDAVLVKSPSGTGNLNSIVMLAAGNSHALALDAQGKVWTWGWIYAGTSAMYEQTLPMAVLSEDGLGQLSDVVAVGSARDTNYAIKSDGTVLAWGGNFPGMLGQGVDTPRVAFGPIPVKSPDGQGPLKINDLSTYPNIKRRGIF